MKRVRDDIIELGRRRSINQKRKKCKMTYYYYDKVLVSNCKLKSLPSYAGKMTMDSVVQLSVQQAEWGAAVPEASEGISLAGDFYQVVIPEKVTYQIHKEGNLVRAYVEDFVWLEKTVMGVPASILALLKGKVLLGGSLLHAGDWAYAAIGERERTADSADGGTGAYDTDTYSSYIRYASPGKSVMVLEREERMEGVAHIASIYSDYAIETLGMLGIFVLQRDPGREAIEPMDEPELKKNAILENIVGYELFPQELKQRASNSRIVNRISQELYMASMLAL